MPEPKLISPLLDGFVMGGPISDHDGVCCCPAMRVGFDDKYIVKIISIPASQVQVDALLLSGAYPNAEAALSYFKELADGTVKEAEVLKQLSRLEGFTAFDGWQVMQKEDGVGYDLYLVGSYKRSLAKFMSRKPMTHLAAVNLGLDLCAALAVCRRAGCLYVDLKPENVYVFDEQTYRIGDLGFVPMSSLRYASLPDKYRSSYTAPEIRDAFSSLNTTIDIYAVGLILYQVYNDGKLPFEGSSPAEVLPAPMYADYEMAEIILKACDPDPANRWQDPTVMGQALVGYMQRNGVSPDPIVPLPVQQEEVPAQPAPEQQDDSVDAPDEDAPAEAAEDEANPADDTAALLAAVDAAVADDTPEAEADVAPADGNDPTSPVLPDPDVQSDIPAEEDDPADLAFLDDLASDETAPSDDSAADLTGAVLTDEASEILAQADELIAHEAPEPVIAPGPIEIPMPEPIILKNDSEEEVPSDAEASDDVPVIAPEDDNEDESDSEEDEGVSVEAEESAKPRKKGRWLMILLVLALLAGIGFGGYWYYGNIYLQNIDGMTVHYADRFIHVEVLTDVADEDLTVYCTDTYGNSQKATLVDGKASFTNLKPSTQYTIHVAIDGFHKLTGMTEKTYTTLPQTVIESMSAITGAEDGSVILSFTVNGEDPETGWIITWDAEGEEPGTQLSGSHWTTITGLTPGKEYTFTVSTDETMDLAGSTELVFTASKVITAQDLNIISCKDGELTVSWNTPEDAEVESWIVHCYNDAGFDQTLEVTETTAVFTGINTANEHNIDVTASGMTQSAHTSMTANPITIVSVLSEVSGSRLNLQWGFDGAEPEGGWQVLYTIDGSETVEVIRTDSNTATVFPVIPGSHYEFTFQAADASTVFEGVFHLDVPDAERFSAYSIDWDEMTFHMLKTPEKANWTYRDVRNEPYTSTFNIGDKASFLVVLDHWQDESRDEIVILYVIRDEEGNLVSADTVTTTWLKMWDNGYCELDVPSIPDVAGAYTMDIFYNGYFVTTQNFTVQ